MVPKTMDLSDFVRAIKYDTPLHVHHSIDVITEAYKKHRRERQYARDLLSVREIGASMLIHNVLNVSRGHHLPSYMPADIFCIPSIL